MTAKFFRLLNQTDHKFVSTGQQSRQKCQYQTKKFLLRENTQNSASIQIGSELDVVVTRQGEVEFANTRHCYFSRMFHKYSVIQT